MLKRIDHAQAARGTEGGDIGLSEKPLKFVIIVNGSLKNHPIRDTGSRRERFKLVPHRAIPHDGERRVPTSRLEFPNSLNGQIQPSVWTELPDMEDAELALNRYTQPLLCRHNISKKRIPNDNRLSSYGLRQSVEILIRVEQDGRRQPSQ